MDNNQGPSLLQRVQLYAQYDAARQEDLESFARDYEMTKARLKELEVDLDEERRSRRNWRDKAEKVEHSVRRGFAVILVDGDAYLFNRAFYDPTNGAGGAGAAHSLLTEANQYIRDHNDGEDLELMTTVFLHKANPLRVLLNAEIIRIPADLDEFLWSFTSSNSLFQVIDCGPGKERADSKLRDTYRFFLNNAQCKRIFLACCHDNGYVAELDKYRHDRNAIAKTTLVKHGNMGNQFYNLNVPLTTFSQTFEMDPIQPIRRVDTANLMLPSNSVRVPLSDTASQSSTEDQNNKSAQSWSTITATVSNRNTRSTASTTPSLIAAEGSKITTASSSDSKNMIPLNRYDQRVDRRLQPPTQQDLDRFSARISKQKLCNQEHLTNMGCYAHACPFDHGQIDERMKHTLKYKARSIPCSAGSNCRKADCFYGHVCPWGNSACTNNKCAYWAKGLHDINDTAVAKVVPAVQ